MGLQSSNSSTKLLKGGISYNSQDALNNAGYDQALEPKGAYTNVLSTNSNNTYNLSSLCNNASSVAQGLSTQTLKGLASTAVQKTDTTQHRHAISHTNWASEHLWDVTMDGLLGSFKSYCPMNQISIELDKLDTQSMQIGGYSFEYPVGTSSRHFSAVFQDDVYGSLAISLATKVKEMHGYRTTGVIPLMHAGMKLNFKSLARSKVSVTELHILGIPIQTIPFVGSQNSKPRDVGVTFLLLGIEIVSSGLPSQVGLQDPNNLVGAYSTELKTSAKIVGM